MLAIKGGTIYTVTKGVLKNGTILIENGKIKEVGTDLAIPEDAEILDAANQWITPGLIEAHSHIAMGNEPSDGGPADFNENSNPVVPFVRAMDAFHPQDDSVSETRKAGFTTICVLPGSANLIGGIGFSAKLREGRIVEEMMIPGTEVMKFALGQNPRRNYREKDRIPKTRMGSAAVLRETLMKAKDYSCRKLAAERGEGAAPEYDFHMEALVPVIRGEMRCRIHCHRSDDIATALRIAEEFNLCFSLEHATEGYMIADILAKKHVPCVIGPMNLKPYKQEVWGRKLETPAILDEAGVEFCLTEDAGITTYLLPIHAGMCIARGLKEETALKALTIRPAKLLGLDERIGSIEAGKDADIAVFNGNPFSSLSRCTHTVVEGHVFKNCDTNI